MKIFLILISLIIFQNCSFDNKSGIWKGNETDKSQKKLFENFEKLSSSDTTFDQIIEINKNFKFQLSNQVTAKKWTDIFYDETNNFENFSYKNVNNNIFKSKKVSRNKLNDSLLFENDFLILNDQKGNIIIFSIDQNRVLKKYNFYKKKYKKIQIKMNLILKNNIIYISDNLGYVYALNIYQNKVLWAKNYKIPFRSNLKIFENKLILANQNNNLFFLNKDTGNLIKSFPTEETLIKNNFVNNLSLYNNQLFFLNTYGSLYLINVNSMRVNWFINLNRSIDINVNNLFTSKEIIYHNDNIVVSSNEFTYILNSKNGSILYKKNFSSALKPIMNKDYLFLITKNDLLISLNLNNGEIIYSYDINQKISEFLNLKKKKAEFKNMAIVNDKIFIFLNNSFFLIFNINGKLEEVKKLPSNLSTHPIFINESILFADQKNRVLSTD